MYTVIHSLDEAENDLYQDWLDALRDGVWELRIDVGAGYRVYYAQVGGRVILLLGGGDKTSQGRDIERAVKLLKDWEKRNGQNTPCA